jgi:lipoate-protein ligase A
MTITAMFEDLHELHSALLFWHGNRDASMRILEKEDTEIGRKAVEACEKSIAEIEKKKSVVEEEIRSKGEPLTVKFTFGREWADDRW